MPSMDTNVEMIELKTSDGEPDTLSYGGQDSFFRRGPWICSRRNVLTATAMVMSFMLGYFAGSSPSSNSNDLTINSVSQNNDHSDSGESKIVQLENDNITKWLESKVTIDDGIRYEVVSQIVHDKNSFTEGLCYANGKLYESVGLYRQSAVLVLDPKTGETLERYPMDTKYFAEGLTYVNGKLIQLTYKLHDGFIYNANNLSATPETFKFHSTTNEGWGLTYDHKNHELIESDGSEFLHFWDPDNMQEKRKIAVKRLDGNLASNINELEYWRGRILANVWYSDVILVINPETGEVEKEYDFSQLWAQHERYSHNADVLNGISVSEDEDILYVTGKNWDRMFLLRLL